MLAAGGLYSLLRVLHLKGLGCRAGVLLHSLMCTCATSAELLPSVLEPLDVRRLCTVAIHAG